MSSVDTRLSAEKLECDAQAVHHIDARRKQYLVAYIRASLIGMILCFAACELIARFFVFCGKPALTSNPQYHAKYLVAKTVTPWKDNIVLCGDSLVKQGLYPELMTAKLQHINPNIRVVNLAVNGGSQSDAIGYLDYLRDIRCTKPRLVVFDFEVGATGRTASSDSGTLASSGYLFDRLMQRQGRSWKELIHWPADLSMLLRYRGAIKHFFMDFFSVAVNPTLFEERSTIQLCNGGDAPSYSGMSPVHNATLDAELNERDALVRTDWSNGPAGGHFSYHSEAYSPIIEYCQKNQIPLMLVWLPHEKYMYDRHWYKAPFKQEWFKARFEEYRQKLFVFPIYMNDLVSDHSWFSDYRHLSTKGCIAASDWLAEEMAKPQYRSLIEKRTD
ncbi:MAG TPA: hypothetical protein V6C97_08910 [Oculatellaceae cyanobacterium]